MWTSSGLSLPKPVVAAGCSSITGRMLFLKGLGLFGLYLVSTVGEKETPGLIGDSDGK